MASSASSSSSPSRRRCVLVVVVVVVVVLGTRGEGGGSWREEREEDEDVFDDADQDDDVDAAECESNGRTNWIDCLFLNDEENESEPPPLEESQSPKFDPCAGSRLFRSKYGLA